MARRGVIHDKNAYLRFKRFIREIIQEEQSIEYWHSVGKSPWHDDEIVIHGNQRSQLGRWYVMAKVKPNVADLLRAQGIELQVTEFPGNRHISIPIDQEACPQGKRAVARN